MGKGEEEALPITVVDSQATARNTENCWCCGWICRAFRFRCVFILVLGVSVLLSALFWLPPFFRRGDHGDLDLDSHYKGHDIVASFLVEKPPSLLKDNFPLLEGDIFDEIGVPNTKVVFISAESIPGSNTTQVTFAVDPEQKKSKISTPAKSLIRASFVTLVLRQSYLNITESLFGESFSFEVQKFVGGLTISPPQSSFPLQSVQILFNFTLNFSVQQILDNFDELTSQLKSGLHLVPYENLDVSLTNPRGSTVNPPTTVQTSVVLAVGNTPSMERLKQLAQTINGSTKNLGLNNTEFGKVKQISLSSILQHSLNGSNGGGTPTSSPTPQPQPQPPQHHHHHHHHHHHDKQLPPAKPPSPGGGGGGGGGLKHSPSLPPIPTPPSHKIHDAKPPDCHTRKRSLRKPNMHPHPSPPPHTTLTPQSPPPQLQNPPPPPLPPPRPAPQAIPALSPLPNVVFAHTHPPSKSDSDVDPLDITPSASFSQKSSCAGGVHLWAFQSFVVLLVLHLLEWK